MLVGRLGGKTAVITGAASWLGGAKAKLFAHEGARVVIGDRCFHSQSSKSVTQWISLSGHFISPQTKLGM